MEQWRRSRRTGYREPDGFLTVEHVHVHAGGQAVFGVVETPGGGDRGKLKDRTDAKQIAHAPQQTMWSADAEQVPLPVAGNAERPLSDAWRTVARRAEG